MIRTDSPRGRIALMVGHCAGMVDLVALPVWVGALISHYRFDPQQAGLLATLFLTGAVLASLLLAPRFQRLSGRWVASIGFGLAALCFWALSRTQDFGTMTALHALAGLATGAALSVTHGTIARSINPHRLFAIVGIALGVFAVVFMGVTPQVVAAAGGPALFVVFTGVMAVGALVSLVAFPVPDALPTPKAGASATARLPAAVWFGIVGVGCIALVQAMTFSFLERVGADRGFSPQAIAGMLIGLGVVSLFPAGLAALLQRRCSARSVMLAGPMLQAPLAAVVMNSSGFWPYAAAAAMMVWVIIFTHTFAFGLLARLDPSGRAMAATPAMVMIGSAIGPVLGGTLVKGFGYGALSAAAAVIAAAAVYAFSRLPRQSEPARREATA